jgi:histidyl-tRNA synthetase
MIGRFLGQDVPAAGFSILFERVVDLIALADDSNADSVVLVHDADVRLETLISLKSQLVAEGKRVRLERRPKNLNPVLERAAEDGYAQFAFVTADTRAVSGLVFKALG